MNNGRVSVLCIVAEWRRRRYSSQERIRIWTDGCVRVCALLAQEKEEEEKKQTICLFSDCVSVIIWGAIHSFIVHDIMDVQITQKKSKQKSLPPLRPLVCVLCFLFSASFSQSVNPDLFRKEKNPRSSSPAAFVIAIPNRIFQRVFWPFFFFWKNVAFSLLLQMAGKAAAAK